jgi:anaerobic selenocysteine-containing dehydrogenase
VVALDPRRSETAARGDDWVQIKPGTDLAFMLALIKIMMEEDLDDAPFLRRHTNMPFLVYKDDQGEWQMVTEEEGRPLVAEEDTTKVRILAKFSNDNRRDIEGGTFCPGLRLPEPIVVEGRRVETVFEAQLEELAEYTPEWAAEIAVVSAGDISRISREFGNTRPAIVDPGWHGARFGIVMMLRRVQAMVRALTGGIDSVGGWMNSGELHHKAAHMYEAIAEGYEMGSPPATLAGMAFAKMVIGTVSKGESFSHGKPGWTWAWNAQEKEAGRFNVALPVMTDTGLRASVEGKVHFDGEHYKTRAFITRLVQPDTLFIYSSFGVENKELTRIHGAGAGVVLLAIGSLMLFGHLLDHLAVVNGVGVAVYTGLLLQSFPAVALSANPGVPFFLELKGVIKGWTSHVPIIAAPVFVLAGGYLLRHYFMYAGVYAYPW